MNEPVPIDRRIPVDARIERMARMGRAWYCTGCHAVILGSEDEPKGHRCRT